MLVTESIGKFISWKHNTSMTSKGQKMAPNAKSNFSSILWYLENQSVKLIINHVGAIEIFNEIVGKYSNFPLEGRHHLLGPTSLLGIQKKFFLFFLIWKREKSHISVTPFSILFQQKSTRVFLFCGRIYFLKSHSPLLSPPPSIHSFLSGFEEYLGKTLFASSKF